jgi:Superfamily II DNA/RNA helicases, SNF2 family
MGLRVPFADYAWPSRSKDFKPFAHQKETMIFLLQNKRAYNFSDLGTGKTMSHLWCADFLRVNDKVKQVLIIGPLSTMQSVWGSEIFFNLPHRRYKIVHGSRQDRVKALRSDVDFLIINHDGISIPEVEKEIIRKIISREIGLIIVDELTAFKKHTTNRSKAMQRISQAMGPDGGLQGLTGAPTPNGPSEAFGEAKVVNPWNPKVPRYFKAFQPMVEYQVGPYLWVATPNATEVVNQILQPAIRFKRDDCIDIPECQYVERIVEFTDQQKKVYNKMKEDLLVEYEQGSITAVNAAVKMMKLLQIAAGSVKDDDGNVMKLDSTTRDEQLWEIFEETGKKKLVVFAAFRASIKHLEEFFLSRKVNVATIHGDVKHETRAKHIQDFQDGDLQVLIIQPQSSAHGITLTASNTIVWYSLIASGEIHVQANGRITRAGQKRKQLIYYLIGCKAEKHLLELLQGKGNMSRDVLSLFEEI